VRRLSARGLVKRYGRIEAVRGALPLGWLVRCTAPMAYTAACFGALATPSLTLRAMGIPHQPGAAAIAGVAALAHMSLGVATTATAWRRLSPSRRDASLRKSHH